MQGLYLDPHQTRERAPTDYENLLGDALEKAYAAGVTDVPAICERLMADCVPSPGGKPWTPELFESEMKRLGA